MEPFQHDEGLVLWLADSSYDGPTSSEFGQFDGDFLDIALELSLHDYYPPWDQGPIVAGPFPPSMAAAPALPQNIHNPASNPLIITTDIPIDATQSSTPISSTDSHFRFSLPMLSSTGSTLSSSSSSPTHSWLLSTGSLMCSAASPDGLDLSILEADQWLASLPTVSADPSEGATDAPIGGQEQPGNTVEPPGPRGREKRTGRGLSARQRRRIEKPEKCPIEGCGKGYDYLNDLKKHMQTKSHREQAEAYGFKLEQHRCPWCPKVYRRSDHLRRHLGAKHGRGR